MKGDFGETSLYNNERISKLDIIFDGLGNIDELNSRVGFVYELFVDKENENIIRFKEMLEFIQSRLLDIGSHLATPLTKSNQKQIKRTKFPSSSLQKLETYICSIHDSNQNCQGKIIYEAFMNLSISTYLTTCSVIAERTGLFIKSLINERNNTVDEIVLNFMIKLTNFFTISAEFIKNERYFYYNEK